MFDIDDFDTRFAIKKHFADFVNRKIEETNYPRSYVAYYCDSVGSYEYVMRWIAPQQILSVIDILRIKLNHAIFTLPIMR